MNDLQELDNATVRELAEYAGVCVRPIVRKLIDLSTGEERVIPIPCGSTKSRVCPPCAEKARQLRISQCLEGWHRVDEPEHDDSNDLDEPDDPDDEQDDPADDAVTGDAERALARRVRSTKRRDDVGELPKRPTADTTLGRTFTAPDGTVYRPSMFLTFTLPSYGRVRRDGTPCNPATYDYRKAALDALHFPALVDRLWQALRRGAGYKAQYFATVEPQKRLALHLHAAVRGTIPRQTVRQVVDGVYHQVWWPQLDEPVYVDRLPVWDERQDGYVDPETHELLPSWDQALDAIDPATDEPAHMIRPGKQFDYQGIIASNERQITKSVGYLTKYLTKSIAEAYDPDTITKRQRAHRDRLHAELLYLPCTPQCANWLRFGVQPKGAKSGMRPGECGKKAHELDNLGHGGRRCLASRQWSGKKLSEHKADRAAVVRETLAEAGIDAPDTDRFAADATDETGQARYVWESLDPTAGETCPDYQRVIKAAVTERNRWRAEYDRAQAIIAARDGPPDNCSATPQPAASDAA